MEWAVECKISVALTTTSGLHQSANLNFRACLTIIPNSLIANQNIQMLSRDQHQFVMCTKVAFHLPNTDKSSCYLKGKQNSSIS